MNLSILYRGPLESCNYGCDYCPFAKTEETREELAIDEAALERFVSWVEARPADDRISVFFTPWGEALIRPWYSRALQRLTRLPQVEKAAIQTNLSASLDWVDGCDRAKLGVWATFHPEWARRDRFLDQIARLSGASVSVGVVGFNRFRDEIAALRAALPPEIYVWVNAVKGHGGPESYTEADRAFFESIDPLFPINATDHPSLGKACRAGSGVIAVDGDGTMRRCHFIQAPIGNLYRDGFESALVPRPCTKDVCGCHIGYVHLEHLGLDRLFGAGLLERVPARRLPLLP